MCLVPHTLMFLRQKERNLECVVRFQEGLGGVLLGLALLLLHLAQLWLVRAWSRFPGGDHQATDRNPAYSPADDLCW